MAKKKIKKKVAAKKPVIKKAVEKKPAIKKSTRKRKPSKAVIFKLKQAAEQKLKDLRKKEKPFVRYSFHIDSIKVDSQNILEEITYNYKGTMVIPKSQKDNYKPGSTYVTGVFIIPSNLEWDGSTKDFSKVSRSDIITLLKNNIRKGHIDGMKEIIEKELMPEFKIIKDLPWKS